MTASWVLLRGLTRERRHWGSFVDTFKVAIGDAQVIALDLPGNGELHEMTSPLTVAGMADYCRAELARRGIAPPYNLVAMSLGAMVSVAWAARHPQEIARCVLINTSMRPFSPFHHRLRPANYLALLKVAFMGRRARECEATILRVTSSLANGHADVLPAWVSYRQEFPVSPRNALRQLIAAVRFRAPARKPAARLLVLTSQQDALVDTRCSQALARAWQVAIAIHPSAGHDLPLDDGLWVAQQVRDWLNH
ncbi:alpha/beta hydrolase [Uliginosibacterium sp. H3]|uniref:Alpha/beta hydrolase n=1 Tax=Uliginosibacterium silvisoli TaxID=3114758 RepID=A0ABU6K7C9_9RHOO|nr:alpha/beta hydrolase [Uliginosibacterium sp. H3]